MKNINIKHQPDDNHVKVTNNSTASLTKLADDSRDLSDKEFKKLLQLVGLYRKADRKADKWANQLDDLILRARTLNDKEWRKAVKLTKSIRKTDKELAEAQKLETRERDRRFNQALINHA